MPHASLSQFRPVLLLDDEVFLEHVAPEQHPEQGPRLLAVRQGLRDAAAQLQVEYTPVAFGDATDEQLTRVHEPAYVQSLGLLAGRTGFLDSDTFISPGSVAAARRAAGSGVALVQSLAAGAARVGMALARPPGHHALADRAMGFCLLNNVAVATAEARRLGHERVLVLDWDVHHGNGTEAMFYEDPAVLFMSLHQFPNYPGTGDAGDVGTSRGRGRNVNLPLPKGGTDADYRASFARVVLPIIEQFAPTLALVSCGFDAHERDPLAEMCLSASGFGAMTSDLLAGLPEACPLGVMLEGGYDLNALRESSAAVARALFGELPAEPSGTAAAPSPLHEQALQRVAAAQRPFWRLD